MSHRVNDKARDDLGEVWRSDVTEKKVTISFV
jgi:hypothetical protein